MSDPRGLDAESQRLVEDGQRIRNWKRWGPYLSDRQWGTVREDYSATGEAWDYFPHDAARSRAYRWGEDGLLGITDRECRLCLSVALWNERDPILKERLFGLTGLEGNHGEDVKELYYFLDATPTSSYLAALYKYPQRRVPLPAAGRGEPAARARARRSTSSLDTGVFDGNRYFDVQVEYAKAAPDDLWMRLTLTNHGPEPAPLHVLPTLWFRNTWAWGRTTEGYWPRPELLGEDGHVLARHASLGLFRFEPGPHRRRCGSGAAVLRQRDQRRAALRHAVAEPLAEGRHQRRGGARPARGGEPRPGGNQGRGALPARGSGRRLGQPCGCGCAAVEHGLASDFDGSVEALFEDRRAEADAFYARHLPATCTDEERRIARQAWAGLHWCKQYYHYSVPDWLEGDPAGPPPPPERKHGRNATGRRTSTTATSSRCRTAGSTPGTRRGTSRSTCCRSARWTRRSPRSSSSCFCANGTCTPTGTSRRTSGRSRT